MPVGVYFQQLFRTVLSRQVEYSYSQDEEGFTTMIPLQHDRLAQVWDFSHVLPFAGEWAWSVRRFAGEIHPDTFLFRLDWRQNEPIAVTLYCRFPSEPDELEFKRAINHAQPFHWHGPSPSAIASSLGLSGPRGIAFRATRSGSMRTALYFRSEEHSGSAWSRRLLDLLASCSYPQDLALLIEDHVRQLYRPGPIGVIGLDDGEDGVPSSLKFDPADVPLVKTFAWLAQIGVPANRIAALRRIAIGLRAEYVTYAGAQYSREGVSGWRVYLACEPGYSRVPGHMSVGSQRTLRPARRLLQ